MNGAKLPSMPMALKLRYCGVRITWVGTTMHSTTRANRIPRPLKWNRANPYPTTVQDNACSRDTTVHSPTVLSSSLP